jgi:predicted nucleotidyltransferase
MTHESEGLLLELKDGLARLYGDTLRGVYLYGSYARGDFDEESDFDVLVVLDDFASYGAEVDRTAGLASESSLRHGLSISMVFVRERDWQAADTPFLCQVRDEAIAA